MQCHLNLVRPKLTKLAASASFSWNPGKWDDNTCSLHLLQRVLTLASMWTDCVCWFQIHTKLVCVPARHQRLSEGPLHQLFNRQCYDNERHDELTQGAPRVPVLKNSQRPGEGEGGQKIASQICQPAQIQLCFLGERWRQPGFISTSLLLFSQVLFIIRID